MVRYRLLKELCCDLSKNKLLFSIICFFFSEFSSKGMVFFHMPYYNPYQTMLMHYMPQSRSASTSAFASGDAVAAGTIIRGK